MKTYPALLLALSAAIAQAAPSGDETTKPFQIFPKNLARQHLGANLLSFDTSKQAYAPAEAAAAWLDDDVATASPAKTGKQDYMLTLPEPQLLTNFCVAMRSAKGTVSLYAADEPAAPGAKSWALLAKDVNIESINQKLLATSFSRFAKYVLIETNLTEAGSLYSVHLYGERPAVSYHLQQRSQPVDTRTVFGPYSNAETAFSESSLYAHSRVSFLNAADTQTAWQKVIDDNPETQAMLAPSKDDAGLVISFDRATSLRRISVLADGSAKGKLEFFVVNSLAKTAAAQPADSDDSQYIRAANVSSTAGSSVAGLTPVATIKFDGANARGSADFPSASGNQLIARWTPDNGGQLLALREVNSFSGNNGLRDQELAPDAVGEDIRVDNSKDGKDFARGGKELLDPVGEALPPKTPFIPGVPTMPPNIPFSP